MAVQIVPGGPGVVIVRIVKAMARRFATALAE
jgi:hypothetical protein